MKFMVRCQLTYEWEESSENWLELGPDATMEDMLKAINDLATTYPSYVLDGECTEIGPIVSISID
jgi:hypothetical protein